MWSSSRCIATHIDLPARSNNVDQSRRVRLYRTIHAHQSIRASTKPQCIFRRVPSGQFFFEKKLSKWRSRSAVHVGRTSSM